MDEVHGDLGRRRYGLLQISCALLLERTEKSKPFEVGQTAPKKDEIASRQKRLQAWFAPDSSPYRWNALYDEVNGDYPAGAQWRTSLDGLTRHDVYDVKAYKGYECSVGGMPVPPLFLGLRPPRYISTPNPRARIPTQRPGDRNSPNLTAIDLDHNDFLVSGSEYYLGGSSALIDARRFMAFLFAYRRSMIFASSLRERMYNVWLPPAVLRPTLHDNPAAGNIAVFPFLGLTRRPSDQEWRFVFTFNAIIAPTESDNGNGNRKITDSELGSLVGCLDGPSNNPIPSAGGLAVFRGADSWREYTEHLLGDGVTGSVRRKLSSPEGTLRNWLELLFFAVARRQLMGPSGRGRRSSDQDSSLADEVLRSIRMTSCWSVLLDGPKRIRPADSRNGSPGDSESWSPKRGLNAIMDCFDHLAVGSANWFRPTDDDRVDQGRVGERTWMSWALPVRRCVVTFYVSRAENFPSRSRLNLFVIFGHMVSSLMTVREIIVKLGHDMDVYRESAEAAERHRKYVIELEEMFDLDIAWTLYRRLYQRLRKLRGLDDMYRGVRDRTEILGELYATLDGIAVETRRTRLSWGAAILAATIIGLGVWSLLAFVPRNEVWEPAVFALAMVSIAVFWGSWGRRLAPRKQRPASGKNRPR